MACAALLALAPGPRAAAQSVWELMPYRIELLVAFAPAPELTPRLQADLIADLVDRTDVLAGAVWHLRPATAPPTLRRAVTSAIETVTVESLPEEWLKSDKVMLLAVSPAVDGYRLTARELDVPTRLFSAPISRPVWQLGKLREVALDAMFEAFAPLARIESVEKQRVALRVKAAALPLGDEQLTLVEPGDVFRPVIRYNDYQGNLRKDRKRNPILPRPIPWTFCTVEEITPSRLECRLHSGLRSPLSGRRRGLTEQLALAVVPPGRPSTLTLQSLSQPQEALAGYEVYARPPHAKTSVLLGRTDRQGRVIVPPAASPLRVLLVRHGGALLARLPMVPGIEVDCAAEIPNDDPRLQAEGSVAGLRQELVDLVARREVLLARARARIEAGKLAEAEELIRQARQLEKSQSDLARMLLLQRRSAHADDPGVQRKIDAMFGEIQEQINRCLDPEPIEQVRQELRNARAAARS